MTTSGAAESFRPYPFDFRRHAPPMPGALHVDRVHPIAIVGGGIAGLTLALDLAVQGIRSVVIEADDSVCFGSRAICFSRRSLEIYERLGVAAPMLEKGLAWTGGRSFYRHDEVLHFRMPHDRMQKLPPMINLQQYRVEDILVDALERHAGLVDLRWQSRVVAATQHPDHVELQVEQPGASYPLRSHWVVACDGGRSTLRETAGLRLQGTAYEGRYVVADIALACDLPTERLAWFDPPSNPGSTILMHRQPDDIWRIDYQLRDDEDGDAAVQPATVLPRVEAHLKMIGLAESWHPIWITLYKANALTLPHYRRGRFLFAGDAAHLVPIFGVRGANSTIDDVDNLAWKLALVVDGKADPSLLDSYSTERVKAAHENLAYGRKSTQFMAPPDFVFRSMREAVLSLALDTPALRPLINPRQSSPVRYDDSPLNATPPRDDGFDAGPAAGAVLPSAPVAWLDDKGIARPGFLADMLAPGRFTILQFDTRGPVPQALRTVAAGLIGRGIGVRLVSVRNETGPTGADLQALDAAGDATRLYGATRGAVYLVRPDGHVSGRWRSEGARAAAEADAETDNGLAAAVAAAITACLGRRLEENRETP
ncbi:MAG: FAD-dependent monooxygenase [Caldimonas sp.]